MPSRYIRTKAPVKKGCKHSIGDYDVLFSKRSLEVTRMSHLNISIMLDIHIKKFLIMLGMLPCFTVQCQYKTERNQIVAKPIWLYLVGSVSGRYYLHKNKLMPLCSSPTKNYQTIRITKTKVQGIFWNQL